MEDCHASLHVYNKHNQTPFDVARIWHEKLKFYKGFVEECHGSLDSFDEDEFVMSENNRRSLLTFILRLDAKMWEMYPIRMKVFYGSLDGFHVSLDASHGSLDGSRSLLDVSYGSSDVSHGSLDALHGSLDALHGSLDAFLENDVIPSENDRKSMLVFTSRMDQVVKYLASAKESTM